MNAPLFVDANVLVCADDQADPGRNARCARWLDLLWSSGRGRLSTQVLNEYYLTVTRKLASGLSQGDARANVRRYQLWKPWPLDHQTVETAWGIEARFGVHFEDALVVAAAQQSGCAYLLTGALEHGRKIGAVAIVDPFATQPEALLAPDA